MAKIWGDAGKAMSPMSFGKSFDRMQGQPLDKSAVITDTTFAAAYAKAETFAASDNAYVGMILSVSDGTTTKFYGVVNEAGDLEEVGSNIELDTSLEAEGKAADAKAVGDAINQLSSEMDRISAVVIVDETNDIAYKASLVLIEGQPAIRYSQV